MPSTPSDDAGTSGPSLLEDFLFVCGFDPIVGRVERNPLVIVYEDAEGRDRLATPHLLVRYRRDIAPAMWMPHLLCEVHLSQDLRGDWRNLLRRVRALRARARENGWDFRILTELEVRNPFLDNARFLDPYLRRRRSVENEKLLLEWIDEFQAADPETVLAAAAKDRDHKAALIPSLWALIGDYMIGCDLTRPLTMSSPIWAVTGYEEDIPDGVYPPRLPR